MVAVAPQLLRLKAYRSVYSMVAKHVRDPHLRQLFSFHSLLVGGNPFTTTSIYTLIHCLERKWGVYFPKGGTGALVAALVKLFEELGGEVRLNAEIAEIVTPRRSSFRCDRRARPQGRLRSGREQCRRGPHLRAAAGAHAEGGVDAAALGEDELQHVAVPDLFRHAAKISRSAASQYYLRAALPRIAARHFSAAAAWPTISRSTCTRRASRIPIWRRRVARPFYVLSPVPHLGKLDIDWSIEGPRYAERILAYLERHYMPDLRREIVTQRIFTPQGFQGRAERPSGLGVFAGAAFAPERLFSGPQSRSKIPGSVFRRRRHASRRGNSRRGELGQGDRRC